MYFRYEAKHPTATNNKWVGIFQVFNPDERRQWSCLREPKWYQNNPQVNSKAWFTEHGYFKWKNKMSLMIENFHFGLTDKWEFRLLKKNKLENIVFTGKTQIIQILKG